MFIVLLALRLKELFLNEGGPKAIDELFEKPNGSLGKPNKPAVSKTPLLFSSWYKILFEHLTAPIGLLVRVDDS